MIISRVLGGHGSLFCALWLNGVVAQESVTAVSTTSNKGLSFFSSTPTATASAVSPSGFSASTQSTTNPGTTLASPYPSPITTAPWPTFSPSVLLPSAVVLGTPANISYTIEYSVLQAFGQNFTLSLCQTNASGVVDSSNTWWIAQLTNSSTLSQPADCIESYCPVPFHQAWTFNIDPNITTTTGINSGYFFLCFGGQPYGTSYVECEGTSEYFPIVANGSAQEIAGVPMRELGATLTPSALSSIASPSAPPTLPLTISQQNLYLRYDGEAPATTAPPATTSSVLATVTGSTPSASASNTAATGSSKKKGLSTGAKVGIALGALAIVALLLILALFCLRRKHARRSALPATQNSGTMLHTDSYPQSALIGEKHNSASPTSLAAQQHNQSREIPNGNHSSTQHHPDSNIPYTPIANRDSYTHAHSPSPSPQEQQIYNTNPSNHPNNNNTMNTGTIPKRKPAATRSSTVQSESGTFESYHDHEHDGPNPIPNHGVDGRHHSQGFASEALHEEGMTAEEVARLEEEERRIDAAIAEAERR